MDATTSMDMVSHMPEPYRVILRAVVSEPHVRSFLAGEQRRASSYDDWTRCVGFVDASSTRPSPER